MILQALEKARNGMDLSEQQMQAVIEAMLQGTVDQESIGALLLALREKGEAVSELVGAAKALRSHMTPIQTARRPLLDTCGTGGDGTKTFNISTAAAIVAAAAGANVAKHGNRKITSATGSADVLFELGIRIDASRSVVENCLNTLGIGFCFAPLLHPAMKHVAEVRRNLGVPTLFNYLGPLCNPAGAEFQVLGVGKLDLHEKIANAMCYLNPERAFVVRGLDGMDEVSLSAETDVFEVKHGNVTRHRWSPDSFGLARLSIKDLGVEDACESAQVIRDVLDGQAGPKSDIVIANAATGIYAVGLAPSLQESVTRCRHAIDSGLAKSLLASLARMTSDN